MQDKGSAEQDASRCAWLFSAPCGHRSRSLPHCPILQHHGCAHRSLAPYAEGKQLWVFLLLSLQQTMLGTTAILIKSLGKYAQILTEFYREPFMFDRCVTEAPRARQLNTDSGVLLCEWPSNVREVTGHRTQWGTEHSEAQKYLCKSQLLSLGHCTSFMKLLELPST